MLRLLLKILLAVIFIAGGINHFLNPAFYLKMVPPFLPYPKDLVAISGFFEVLFGAMLLVPRLQRLAALGLIALLIAVFPANIYMLVNHELWPDIPILGLWLRLPFQLVFVAWAWMFVRKK